MRRTASALALGKDVDGGLVYQGFSPKTQTGRLPVDKYVSKPFFFGGSNIRQFYSTK
jgi:hypothetical protein